MDHTYGRLGYVCENGLRAGPVTGALADVAPHDGPVGVDDEDGGGGEAVTEEVVDVESLGNLVVGIGQHGVRRLDELADARVDRRDGGNRQGHDLRSSVLKGLVLVAQLNQLRSVRSSPAALEEDENDGALLKLLPEGEGPSTGTIQGEGRGDVRDLRPRDGGEGRGLRRQGGGGLH